MVENQTKQKMELFLQWGKKIAKKIYMTDLQRLGSEVNKLQSSDSDKRRHKD